MAYIGNQPTVGNFLKLDAIVTSATATYNLLNGGVAYTPASVLNMIVSLNGVIQEPTTASNVGGFTVSGSTIVFTSALTSADVIDFILVLGDVLNIGTPSDGTVTFPKVTSNLITGATAETTIAGGDLVLLYDDSASALRKMTRTNFVAGVGGLVGFATAKQPNTTFINSTSFTSTGLTLNYTPVNGASNKIIVLLQGGYGQDDLTGTNSQTRIRQTANTAYDVFSASTGLDVTEGASFNALSVFALDTNVINNTPLTYQLQANTDDATSDIRPFDYITLSVMEIAV